MSYEEIALWLGGLGVSGFIMRQWVWPWLHKTVPSFLGEKLGSLMSYGLKGEGIKDEDVKMWLYQVVLATVILAEAKFPEPGKGLDKYEYVLQMLSRKFPFVSGFIKSYKMDLKQLIERCVAEIDKSMETAKDTGRPTAPLLPHVSPGNE